MKRKYIIIILPVLFLVVAGFVIMKYTNKGTEEAGEVYSFIPRAGNNNSTEWQSAKKNAAKLIAKIKANPADTKSMMALANAYIIESRTSGNFAYYDAAAMKMIKKILQAEPNNYEALMLQALVELSGHHFTEALATANRSLSIDSNSAFIYGLLVDANVELGNYAAAVDAAEKMISRRPDLRSYSRIAYLREIHGDYPGAIEAMKMAVASGTPSEEQTEWCRTQLAKLYENSGEIDKASFLYQTTLAARPGYAPAQAGLARIALFENKYDSAVYYYEQLSLTLSDLYGKLNLLEAYRLGLKTDKESALKKQILASMHEHGHSHSHEAETAHHEDKEMTYAYITLGKFDKALRHAKAEYDRRPLNIDVNETMAWALYKNNEANKAIPYIESALKTKSANPTLLSIAGLIYNKTGNKQKGKEYIERAFHNNPVLSQDLKRECLLALK